MCSLHRNYDVIRNWERFETGPLTVTISCLIQNVSDDLHTYMYIPGLVYRLYMYLTVLNKK